ncbi:hypothetical protein GCM10023328_20210 [Modestobacter marinus]|uniref:Uncharacterized protein n=1 Tax=Modestobacter marinus TaxID=477641 RepID=A0A846LJW9_9ACTN|nr:AAA family ATPase [Modestobacter marinus]NIH65605.1 hypothetical protein [Modestobacter marinus]GGL65744.1 hypothetical protein GCM10011589_22420 [Modestobacter marinus]
MAKAQDRRLRGSFTLGGEQAEADPLLTDGFFESGQFLAAASQQDPRCFLVGRTGVGKSAVLQRLEQQDYQHVIRITPEDLSLPYIADLGVLQYLNALNVHLDPLFIALWKHVLLIEIIRKRYKVDTPAAKQNFLSTLMDKIRRDRSKAAALEYLEEFEGKFWCETDERVKDITTRFENQIRDEAGGDLSLPGIGGAKATTSDAETRSTETRVEQAERFQRIVNETQLPRLNKMITVLDEDILDDPQNYTLIVIDDLDRDWADEQVANALIRCLFRAVIDLKRVRNLKILVGLRTNIFQALDFGAKTGGQEEKFRSLTMQLRWTPADMEALLSARARAAAALHDLPSISGVKDLLPATNKTRGNALEYVLRRTLLRPRDAVAYFNECLALTGGKPRITWDMIHSAERPYSKNRLLALRDEWKPNYPGIERVFQAFEATPVLLDRDRCRQIFEDVALLTTDPSFAGSRWITSLTEPIWNARADDSWEDMYSAIVALLFEVGFLGCGAGARGEVVFAQDDSSYLAIRSNLERCTIFSVHPAFRSALDIRHD